MVLHPTGCGRVARRRTHTSHESPPHGGLSHIRRLPQPTHTAGFTIYAASTCTRQAPARRTASTGAFPYPSTQIGICFHSHAHITGLDRYSRVVVVHKRESTRLAASTLSRHVTKPWAAEAYAVVCNREYGEHRHAQQRHTAESIYDGVGAELVKEIRADTDECASVLGEDGGIAGDVTTLPLQALVGLRRIGKRTVLFDVGDAVALNQIDETMPL